MTYAAKTEVPVRRTRDEIEHLLLKHKAQRIGVVLEVDRASVGFTIDGWSVRFNLPLVSAKEADHALRKNQWDRIPAHKVEAWMDQTSRARWRALLLCIKAKLVSVESGVESFEQAFMAHLVLPGGATVGEANLPELRNHARQLPSGLPTAPGGVSQMR